MSIKVRNQETGQWEEISNTKGDDYVLTQTDKQDIANLIPRDSTMSDTSENAVQNKVVKKYVDDRTTEGEWELIEEITTEVEAVFSRDKEPDGTPYNFKSIMVFLNNENNPVKTQCVIRDKNAPILDLYINGQYNKAYAINENDYINTGVMVGTNKFVYNKNYAETGFERQYFDGRKIKKINTSGVLPLGTTVVIRAIRAKEGEA